MILSKVLGRRVNADIYEFGEHHIKVFHDHVQIATVIHEFENTMAISKCYQHAATVVELRNIEEFNGIVFSDLSGISMLHELEENPGKLNEYAKLFSTIHHELHLSKPNDLLDQTSYYMKEIEKADLKEDTKIYLNRLLKTLPCGDHLCHGDFNPDRIILNKDGYKVIDFTTSYIGHPLSDVAKTCVVLSSPRVPDEASKFLKKQLKKGRQTFMEIYQSEYDKQSTIDLSLLRSFYKLAAVTRLNEHIIEEKNWLLSIIGEDV